MGHTWREMDPEGAARQDSFISKRNKLVDELAHKKLSEFEAEDVPHLATLFSFISLPSDEQAVKHFERKSG